MALVFDPAERIRTSSHNIFQSSGVYTWGGWLKITTLPATGWMTIYERTVTNWIKVEINNFGALKITQYFAGGTVVGVKAVAFIDSEWHHLACTSDTVGGRQFQYFDGVTYANGARNDPIGAGASGQHYLGPAGDGLVCKTIDWFGVRDQELSPAEIGQVHGCVPLETIVDWDAVGAEGYWWPMDDPTTGTWVPDDTGTEDKSFNDYSTTTDMDHDAIVDAGSPLWDGDLVCVDGPSMPFYVVPSVIIREEPWFEDRAAIEHVFAEFEAETRPPDGNGEPPDGEPPCPTRPDVITIDTGFQCPSGLRITGGAHKVRVRQQADEPPFRLERIVAILEPTSRRRKC